MVVTMLARRLRRGRLARWVGRSRGAVEVRFASDLADYLTIVRTPSEYGVLGILDLSSLDQPAEALAALLATPLRATLLNAVVVAGGARYPSLISTQDLPLGTVLVTCTEREIVAFVEHARRRAYVEVSAPCA
jgi:hypothetical protein